MPTPRKTGQQADVTFGVAPLNLKVTSITEPDYDGDAFESPDLSLDVGDCMPMEPTDLPVPGTIEVECEANEELEVEDFIQKKQTVIVTYPLSAGMTNAATKTWANAFIKSYKPGSLQTNGRRLSTLSVQVTGYPVVDPASA